ncbi:DUF805 domain-containing protein [Sphingomonas sp. DT-51]|uniref:DUF805 domain-containing protein n=1 Tax=Sphingomonas sp. DT-51 TaxID=3396165 RepID=UPI003F1DCA60
MSRRIGGRRVAVDDWIRPWRLYADLDGRASRREYLCFHLGAALVIAAAIMVTRMIEDVAAWLIAALALGESNAAALLLFAMMLLPLLAALLLLVPSTAVSARRLRDLGAAWSWLLLLALPFGGVALAAVLALVRGTDGPTSAGTQEVAAMPAPSDAEDGHDLTAPLPAPIPA